MKRSGVIIGILFVSLILVSVLPVSAAEPPVLSTNELVENSYKWDGKTVSFRGEVLQDVMKRADGTWINLSDGNNTAMGVFVPAGVALPPLSWTETYRTQGDTVLVTGIFHRACPQDQGETDIHAASVRIVAEGHEKSNPVQSGRIVWFFVLAALLALVLWLYYRTPRHRSEA